MNKHAQNAGPVPGPDWIDAQEVMEMLKIRPSTLKHWRNTGIIPYSNFGGKLLYDRSEILLLLEKNRKRKTKTKKTIKKKAKKNVKAKKKGKNGNL